MWPREKESAIRIQLFPEKERFVISDGTFSYLYLRIALIN